MKGSGRCQLDRGLKWAGTWNEQYPGRVQEPRGQVSGRVQEPGRAGSQSGQLDRGMYMVRYRDQGGCKILQNTGKVQEPVRV